MTNEPGAAARRRRDLRGSNRRRRIVEMLDGSPEALTVEELAAAFKVSLATVRRDLARLRNDRVITRTYGGAAPGPREQTIGQRQTTRRHAKDCIGRVAARYVRAGDVVILDAGTTTEAVAANLMQVDKLTVITNGLGAINRLVESEVVSVVVLGGALRRTNQTIGGLAAEAMLRHFHASTAFMGADAVDPRWGIASRTPEQCQLKSLMMERAERVVVVVDSSKLDRDGFHYWSPLPPNCQIITDEEASPASLNALRESGLADITVVPLRDASVEFLKNVGS